MKKRVCELYEHGEHYYVYERNGYYIKENATTGEEVVVPLDDYNFYNYVGKVNEYLVNKKGDSVIVDESSQLGLENEPQEQTEEISEDFFEAVKKSANDGASLGDDEKTLRDLEKLIDSFHQSEENEIITQVPQQGEYSGRDDSNLFDNLDLLDGGALVDMEEGLITSNGDYVEHDDAGASIQEESQQGKYLERDDSNLFDNLDLLDNGALVDMEEGLITTNGDYVEHDAGASIQEESQQSKHFERDDSSFFDNLDLLDDGVLVDMEEGPIFGGDMREIFLEDLNNDEKPKKKHRGIVFGGAKTHKIKVKKSRKPKKKSLCKTVTKIAAVVLGLAIVASVASKAIETYQESKTITFEFNDDETRMETINSTYIDVINNKEDLTDELKVELSSYMSTLFSYELSNETYQTIINNINKYDFTGLTSLDINNLIELLNGNKNALVIAHQLYNYKHDISSCSITKFQMIADVLSFSDEATLLFLDGTDINKILESVFGVNDVIDVNCTSMSSGECNNLKLFIEGLKSKSFGKISDSCELENNIFNSYIKIFDNNTKCYLYFDKTTRKGISELIYSQKLSEMFSIRQDELDYTNVRDRELLYFYANSLLNPNNINETDISDAIMKGVNDPLGVFDIFDIMRYMSDSEVDHLRAVYLYGLVTYGSDALPLLQEINMCLKLDLEDGLISQESYDAFIDHLNLGIELYAPGMADEFKKANEANLHMNGYTLKLFDGCKL